MLENIYRYPRNAPGLLQFWLPQRFSFYSRYRNNLHLLLPRLDSVTILALQKTQSSFAFLSRFDENGSGIWSRCSEKILQLCSSNSWWILGYLSIRCLCMLYCLCCFEYKAGNVLHLHNTCINFLNCHLLFNVEALENLFQSDL